MTRTRYGACPLSVRFGACPVCVRDGACPVCVSGRGMSGLRPVRSVTGLRPGQGMSALRPVRSVFGVRPGSEHVRSAVWAEHVRFAGRGRTAGLFLLLRPDWLPRWVYWGVLALGTALTLGEMALDYRRRRPRRRWRDAGLVLLSLSVVWIVIMPPFFFLGSLRREGVGPRHAGIGCRCARRMRRLPAALAAFARRG